MIKTNYVPKDSNILLANPFPECFIMLLKWGRENKDTTKILCTQTETWTETIGHQL